MVRTLYKSMVVTALLALVLCGAYPVLVWMAGEIFFRAQTEGSLVARDGKVVGSSLIGQSFGQPRYFHGRPSAAGEKGYDALSSSGSNLGPTSKKFLAGLESNVKAVLAQNPGLKQGQVPVDLVTASGSGLDPHISAAGAEAQVARVAAARGMTAAEVRAVVARHTEAPRFGILGETTVNVLETNLDLDQGKK